MVKKMAKKKWIRSAIIVIIIFIIIMTIKYISILNQYKEVMNSDKSYNWSITQHPFYNTYKNIEFIIDDTKEIGLNLWCESLTGNVELKITDEKGNINYNTKFNQAEKEYSLPLEQGKYKLEINISNFTGAVALGYENIVVINNLPKENYSIIPGNPSNGFQWEYILYIPNKVTINKLLVVPNNTGTVSDNIDIHKENAKGLILYKSKLADELGVPLLVPIFPRPRSHDELYTHALDRATILTNISELKRLDLQLIAMIDDSKKILSQNGIKLDEKILMSGFSASGDFTDRFTFLHPEIVKAAVIGGSANIIPYNNLNGQNLPYPIGIYDYEKITGKKFDVNLIADVYRYIYKGSDDEGGWMRSEENGKVTTYTGKEYYEKFKVPQLIESLKQHDGPIYINGSLTNIEQEEILFRVYDKKILIDRFLIIKSIFNELNLDKNKFIVYERLGHEITKEIREDELEFFKKILKN